MSENSPAASTSGKVAIVTGGSGGIGKAVSERLVRDGFRVVVGYSGNADKANEVVDSIKNSGGQGIALAADVSQPDAAESLFRQTLTSYGRVDVVVHAAGIMPLALVAESAVEQFDQVVNVNLRSTFLIFHEAAKHVADGGRIIAFSSSVLAKAFPTYGAYVASKMGVEGLVHVLANELGKRGVTVNAVAPGPVETPLFTKGKSPEEMAKIAGLAPLGRIGQPDDIAGVVSFLAGPDGAWINSQVLRANGGFAF